MTDALQAILDDTVATGAAPFVIAAIADAGGTIWSGVAGDCAPGRRAATSEENPKPWPFVSV